MIIKNSFVLTENGDIISPELRKEIQVCMAISMISANALARNWDVTTNSFKETFPVMLQVSGNMTEEQSVEVYEEFIKKHGI